MVVHRRFFLWKKNILIKMVRVFWRKIIKNINCMAPHKNHTPIVNTVQVFNNWSQWHNRTCSNETRNTGNKRTLWRTDNISIKAIGCLIELDESLRSVRSTVSRIAPYESHQGSQQEPRWTRSRHGGTRWQRRCPSRAPRSRPCTCGVAVDLHHGQTPNKIAEYLQSSICTEKITSQPSKNLIFALTWAIMVSELPR